MTGDVHDALASISNEYEVRRELRAVPPHAVYEVRVEGTRAVCKVARGPRAAPATEARVIERIGRETSVPVPEILAVGEDWFVAKWCDESFGDPEVNADEAFRHGDRCGPIGDGRTPRASWRPSERATSRSDASRPGSTDAPGRIGWSSPCRT